MIDDAIRRRGNAGWLAGIAGLAAVGSLAGVTVARSLIRRVTDDDPYAAEDFELLDADRSSVVTTTDGVPLAVREVGPTDAPLTVVFAHGFCLRMGAFYFQRARLSEQWGDQVRMVFYDQRGHGQSGEAPPDTHTVTQLGQDLESVLAVVAPRAVGCVRKKGTSLPSSVAISASSARLQPSFQARLAASSAAAALLDPPPKPDAGGMRLTSVARPPCRQPLRVCKSRSAR